MNFNQISYFVETVRCRSINKAARNLEINPSSLLAALNNLDRELGCTLLERTKQGVVPTISGESFYKDCMQILALKDRWGFLKFNRSLKKKISILVIPSLYHSIFGDIVGECIDSDSEYTLDIFEKNTFEIENLLDSRKFSLALTTYLEDDMQYISSIAESFDYAITKLAVDPYTVLVRENHPLACRNKIFVQDLRPYSLVDSYNKTNFKFGLHSIFNSVNNIYINERIFQIEYIARTDAFGLFPSIMRNNATIRLNRMKMIPLEESFSPLVYILLQPSQNRIAREESDIVRNITTFFQKFQNSCS